MATAVMGPDPVSLQASAPVRDPFNATVDVPSASSSTVPIITGP